jgi:hypothetical protein
MADPNATGSTSCRLGLGTCSALFFFLDVMLIFGQDLDLGVVELVVGVPAISRR